jgi:hypothetical protein
MDASDEGVGRNGDRKETEKSKITTFSLLTTPESDSMIETLHRKIVPKPNPKKHMKKTLAIAAAVAMTAVSSNAAYIFSGDSFATVQPSSSSVYGTLFTTSTATVLDKFAVYDFLGDGWVSEQAKTVALYALTGSTYSQITAPVVLTSITAGQSSDLGLVGSQQFYEGSFAGLAPLAAGTYFLGFSEIKPANQVLYGGYVSAIPSNVNPAATAVGLASYSFGILTSTFTAVPASFTSSEISSNPFSGVGVIPSLVNVPEAGSSAMALALGAMVVRFRSRRA